MGTWWESRCSSSLVYEGCSFYHVGLQGKNWFLTLAPPPLFLTCVASGGSAGGAPLPVPALVPVPRRSRLQESVPQPSGSGPQLAAGMWRGTHHRPLPVSSAGSQNRRLFSPKTYYCHKDWSQQHILCSLISSAKSNSEYFTLQVRMSLRFHPTSCI